MAGEDHKLQPGNSVPRTAVVTGGTSGIGRAIGKALADEGCDVTLVGRTEEEVEACRSELAGMHVLACDVTDPAGIARLASLHPQLDVLVNAAGMLLRDGQEFEPANFERVVEVNLSGTMRVSLALLEALAARRGCVINVASMLSFFGSGYVPGYSASKGGIVQLTKSLAIAWAPRGIRVNALAPGWIRTPLTEPLYRDPARRQAILDRTPLGRWGEPEDVARAARFLASPDAAFITGVILPVDGGYLIA